MFCSLYLYVAFVLGSNGLGNILFFHGVVDFDTLYFVVSLLINIFMVGWLHVNATLPIIYRLILKIIIQMIHQARLSVNKILSSSLGSSSGSFISKQASELKLESRLVYK